MAKFGKSLLELTIIGAAAAGTYYYLKKQDGNVPADMDEDDDFDNFDADVEDGAASAKKRSYVNINFNTVEEKAKVAAEKVADVASKAADSIGSFLNQAEGKVEEFFDDRKNAANDAMADANEAVAKAGEAVEDAVEEVKENLGE